jgi:hypothetical protein
MPCITDVLTDIGRPVLYDNLCGVHPVGYRPPAENVRFGLISQVASPGPRVAAEDKLVCHPILQNGTGVIANSQIVGAANDNCIGGSTAVKGAKVVPDSCCIFNGFRCHRIYDFMY